MALLAAAQPSFAAWALDGVRVANNTLIASLPVVAPDGYGGILVAWMEDINQMGHTNQGAVYVQRIASDGTVIWGATGIKLTLGNSEGFTPLVTADGEGGAIVAWSDPLTLAGARIQRVNFLGSQVWTTGGAPVGPQIAFEWAHALVPDGVGGVTVLFVDWRDGESDFYLQRLNASGVGQWGTGVPVCIGAWSKGDGLLIPDGEGGVIAAWHDQRSDPDSDVYAQRVNFLATALWTTSGVQMTTLPGSESAFTMTGDGASGLIGAWSYNLDIFAQRLDFGGTKQWGATGLSVAVIPTSNQFAPTVATDDNGGAFIFWKDTRSGNGTQIYGERLDGSGAAYWIPGGIPLSGTPGSISGGYIHAVRDGNGGAIVAFGKSPVGDYEARAMRVDDLGSVLWNESALSATYHISVPEIVGSATGEAILAWQDNRGAPNDQNYAMKVPFIASGVDDHAPSIGAVRILSVNPNPFNGSAQVQLDVERGGPLALEIFDVAGRRVWSGRDAVGGPGGASIRIRAHDDSGAALASGVYFLRVTSHGVTATHRLVVLR